MCVSNFLPMCPDSPSFMAKKCNVIVLGLPPPLQDYEQCFKQIILVLCRGHLEVFEPQCFTLFISCICWHEGCH